MLPFSSHSVQEVFDSYPEQIRDRMLAIRDLIFSVAQKLGIGPNLTETLKWGEPSYLCKTGSTIRIHWKENDPEGYRVFFHCQTTLVSTFREIYPDTFHYEGNRALRLSIHEEPDLA